MSFQRVGQDAGLAIFEDPPRRPTEEKAFLSPVTERAVVLGNNWIGAHCT